jgi:hypothetical protein
LDYLDWSNRLGEYFFRPENSGRRVYLYATRELVERIGQESGASFQDFIDCVKRGPEWARRSGLCQRVFEESNGWRRRGLQYPPYIASLSLFVIAAGLEGDFEPNEYYGRLWKLLGLEGSGTPKELISDALPFGALCGTMNQMQSATQSATRNSQPITSYYALVYWHSDTSEPETNATTHLIISPHILLMDIPSNRNAVLHPRIHFPSPGHEARRP